MSIYADNSFWINTDQGETKVTVGSDNVDYYIVVNGIRIYEGDLNAFVDQAKLVINAERARANGNSE